MTPERQVRVFSRLRDLHPDFSLNYAIILFTIAARPGITQRQLYTGLALNDSSASRALAVLSDDGDRTAPGMSLVRIDILPNDRRERVLSLTPKGERLIQDCMAYLYD